MSIKREAAELAETEQPPTKRLATEHDIDSGTALSKCVAYMSSIESVVSTLSSQLEAEKGKSADLLKVQKALHTQLAEQARALEYTASLESTVRSCKNDLDTERKKLADSRKSQRSLQAQLDEHVRVEREYGVKYKWETKLKVLKAEQDMKLQSLKEVAKVKQQAKDEEWREKMAMLRSKHQEALLVRLTAYKETVDKQKAKTVEEHEARERAWKMRYADLKMESTKTLSSKEAAWKVEMRDVKKRYEEQLAKVRANV